MNHPNIDISEDFHWTSARTTSHSYAYHSTSTTARPCLFEGSEACRAQVRLQRHVLHFTVDYDRHVSHTGNGRFIRFRIMPREVRFCYYTVETFPEKAVDKTSKYSYTAGLALLYSAPPCHEMQPCLSPLSDMPLGCISDFLIREDFYAPARISFCWPEHTSLKLWYDPARDYLPFKTRKQIPLHQSVSPARCGFNPIMSGSYGPCCRSFLAAPRCQDADDVPMSL